MSRTPQEIEAIARELFEDAFWPPSLSTAKNYRVQTDDSDGQPEFGQLTVAIAQDGDVHLWISGHEGMSHPVRMRTYAGGGRHLMVRNALLLLALAIQFEQDEREH